MESIIYHVKHLGLSLHSYSFSILNGRWCLWCRQCWSWWI